MLFRRMGIATATVLSLGLAAEARDPSIEFWGSTEFQMTLSPETDPNLAWHDVIPDRLRFYTEHQFSHDVGLHQTLLRMGPIWNLLPFLSVAAHLTSVSFPNSSGGFGQEIRLEAEPVFRGSFSPGWNWANRHRFEWRMRPDQSFGRYRTRFALNYAFAESPFTAFVSNEFHFLLNETGFSQNRAQLGLSYQLSPSAQMSASYLSRFVRERDGSWTPENGLWLSVFYSSQEDGIFQQQAD